MKQIALTKGKFTLVDDEDFDYLNRWRWKFHDHRNGYAMRSRWIKGGNGKYETVYMAKEIMHAQKGQQVDHIDGNSLDNRKQNLRICMPIDNSRNKKVYKNNRCGIKGVYPSGKKFVARIIFNKKFYYLGTFSDISKAAKAYNQAAKKYFGEFARLNQI